MLLAGQQSTFPKLLFIQNRMNIERLIDQGLLLSGTGQKDLDELTCGERESMHLHGQALRSAAAEHSSATDEDDGEVGGNRFVRQGSRSSSMLAEMKRQSGVFFDDVALEDGEEDTGEGEGESEEERGVAVGVGPKGTVC